MATMAGKQILLEGMLAEGVRYMFGNPGTYELPVMDALQDYPQIQYILALQESSVVSAADAYARVSGEVGVAQLHITVGLGNGIAMLYDAWRGGYPVLVFAGQQDSRLLVQEPGLYSDMVRTTRQFTKWSTEVAGTANIPLVLRRAFKEARSHPRGPVFISFPFDTLVESADVEIAPGGRPYTSVRPDPEAVEAAVELLVHARQPLLVVGDGVGKARAWEQAVALAELLGARVHTTGMTSLVNFPTAHPLYLGSMNFASAEGQSVLAETDVLVAVGAAPFPVQRPGGSAVPKGLKVIQVDVNPWEVAKNTPVDLGIQADPRWALRDLVEAARRRISSPEWREAEERKAEVRKLKEQQRDAAQRAVEGRWNARPISGARLLREIQDVAPKDKIIVHEAFGDRPALEATMDLEPGSFYGLAGGGIGWGMGATIGAKLAAPDHPVIGIVGDGSAMYSIQALYTAVRHQVPVVWVIFNNQSYRILKVNMLSQLGETARESQFIGMDFADPKLNFEKMAQSFGVDAVRVEEPQDIRPALQKALGAGKPFLVDVVVDGALDRPF